MHVAVIASDDVVRRGIKAILDAEPGIGIVWDVVTLEEGNVLLGAAIPDVAVVAIDPLSERDSEWQRAIGSLARRTRVLLVVSPGSERLVAPMVEDGLVVCVSGCVSESALRKKVLALFGGECISSGSLESEQAALDELGRLNEGVRAALRRLRQRLERGDP